MVRVAVSGPLGGESQPHFSAQSPNSPLPAFSHLKWAAPAPARCRRCCLTCLRFERAQRAQGASAHGSPKPSPPVALVLTKAAALCECAGASELTCVAALLLEASADNLHPGSSSLVPLELFSK